MSTQNGTSTKEKNFEWEFVPSEEEEQVEGNPDPYDDFIDEMDDKTESISIRDLS